MADGLEDKVIVLEKEDEFQFPIIEEITGVVANERYMAAGSQTGPVTVYRKWGTKLDENEQWMPIARIPFRQMQVRAVCMDETHMYFSVKPFSRDLNDDDILLARYPKDHDELDSPAWIGEPLGALDTDRFSIPTSQDVESLVYAIPLNTFGRRPMHLFSPELFLNESAAARYIVGKDIGISAGIAQGQHGVWGSYGDFGTGHFSFFFTDGGVVRDDPQRERTDWDEISIDGDRRNPFKMYATTYDEEKERHMSLDFRVQPTRNAPPSVVHVQHAQNTVYVLTEQEKDVKVGGGWRVLFPNKLITYKAHITEPLPLASGE